MWAIVPPHGVALQILDDRRVHGAVDGEVEHGVETGGAGHSEAQLAAVDADGQRRHAVAVHDTRDAVLAAQPA